MGVSEQSAGGGRELVTAFQALVHVPRRAGLCYGLAGFLVRDDARFAFDGELRNAIVVALRAADAIRPAALREVFMARLFRREVLRRLYDRWSNAMCFTSHLQVV